MIRMFLSTTFTAIGKEIPRLRWALAMLAPWLCGTLCAQTPLPVDTWPAGLGPRAQLPAERALDWEFQDVQVDDLERWLSWARIESPVEASGKLSGWVWGQRSDKGWFNFHDYRVEGEVTSPALRLDKWLVRGARLRFGYQAGVWYVGQLKGDVSAIGSDKAIGQVDLAAKLDSAKQALISLSGKVTSIDLGEILHSLGVDVPLHGGGTLVVSANVPMNAMDDLARWTASAALTLSDVAVPDWPPARLDARAQLEQAAWTLTDAKIGWAAQTLRLSGNGRLENDFPFSLALGGDEVSISELLRELGQVDLARQLAGRLDLQVTAQGDAASGLRSASAQVASPQLSFQSLALDAVRLNANYAPQSIELNIASAKLAGGDISGNATWAGVDQLAAGLPTAASLSISSLPLEAIDLVPIPLAGNFTGKLEMQSSERAGRRLWASKGNITVKELVAFQTPLGDSSLTWTKGIGSQDLNAQLVAAEERISADLTAVLEDEQQSSVGSTRLGAYRATGSIREFASQVPLSDAQWLPFVANGIFELTGEPGNWLETGKAELEKSQVKLGEQTIRLETAVLEVSPNEFRLRQFRLLDERGRIAGSAIVRRDSSGTHQLNLRVADVQLEPYLVQATPEQWHTAEGVVAFEARLSKPASETDWMLGWTGPFDGSLRELKYRSLPVGEMQLTGALSLETINVALDGTVLGAEAHAAGDVPLALLYKPASETTATDSSDDALASWEFSAKLIGLDIRRIAAVLSDPRLAARFQGAASISIDGQASGQDDLTAQVQLSVPILTHDRAQVAKDFRAKLSYAAGGIQVEELSGKLADGAISMRGGLQVAAGERVGGELLFDWQRVQLREVVALPWPQYAEHFDGVGSFRGAIRFNRQISISGSASAQDAVAYGIPIQRGRGDLRIVLNTDGTFAELASHNLNGTAIGGDFSGAIKLRGGSRLDLTANAKVRDGKLDQLSKALQFERIVGTGRFDGSVDLRSRDAPDLQALIGALQIDFENGDAQSVPVLSDIGRIVPLMQVASTDISGGTMHARIGQGQLRIQDFLINSNAFWMVGDGTASLTGGRLDIDAILQTGGGIEQQISQNLMRKLAVVAFPQVAVVTELNDLLRNRSLYFHIGGTTSHPVIQAKPAQTIGKAILQNIQQELLAAPVAASTPSRAANK